MPSSKIKRDKRTHSKKEKLSKLIKNDSDSDGGESEHELSHYLNDRVKLMKEVLKIIKPKKIRTMAPDCMQNLDSEEINSMLLDELLGISKKRLKYIFNGQTLNEESSSTDSEEDQPIDIISLDDISDDEFIIDLDSDKESRKKHKRHKHKIKEEPKKKRVKEEKSDKIKDSEKSQNQMSEQNLMSVLELLELQARARAIRSQLVLENNKKTEEAAKVSAEVESSDNEDAVIVESPENVEIVITSSDSENEHPQNAQQEPTHQFRRSTDDSPEKNSDKAAEITEKSIADGESKSSGHEDGNETAANIPTNTEVISKESNGMLVDTSLPKGKSDKSGNDSTMNVDNTKVTEMINNEEQVIEVVHIPLPKDKSDNSAAAPSVCTKNILTEDIEQHSMMESTKKLIDSNLKCGNEPESNVNPIETKGTSNEEDSKESKSLNEKCLQKTTEKSEKKLLQESDHTNSKSASQDACSSVEIISCIEVKTSSQEEEIQMRNDDGSSKRKDDESSKVSKTKKKNWKTDPESIKGKSLRVCRRKLSKLAKEKAENLERIQKPSSTSGNQEKCPMDEQGSKSSLEKVQKKNITTVENDGIILNVDQSEMDCIHLD